LVEPVEPNAHGTRNTGRDKPNHHTGTRPVGRAPRNQRTRGTVDVKVGGSQDCGERADRCGAFGVHLVAVGKTLLKKATRVQSGPRGKGLADVSGRIAGKTLPAAPDFAGLVTSE